MLKQLRSLLGFILATPYTETVELAGCSFLGESWGGKKFEYTFETSRGTLRVSDKLRVIYAASKYPVRYQVNWLTGELRGIILSEQVA